MSTFVRSLLRASLLLLVRILGALSAWQASRRSVPSPKLLSPRILLIRPDHLGDLVLTTPVLNALRERLPEAQITMMTGPWSSEVVARHPALDRLVSCPFPGFQRAARGPLEPYKLLLRTARQIRQERYDLAINLRPDFWWGAALLYLAAIPRRIGYAISPGTPFLTTALPFPPAEHATVSNLCLLNAGLESLGAPALPEPYTPARYPLAFDPTAEEESWADANLAPNRENTPLVVIHPGTGGAVKLWRNSSWTTLAEKLSAGALLSQPAQIVLTGSPKERPLLEEIAQGMSSTPTLITNATVGQLAALLARAQLVLGVDSGPLHLATAQNTPTVRLFGPTDSHIFGPWGSATRHVVITASKPCPGCPAIPCGRLDFPESELPLHPCVKNIPEQQFEEAIRTLVISVSEKKSRSNGPSL